MPIYDQGYRRFEARAALRRVRFWPVTREALRLLLVRKAFLALLVMCWLPFVGFAVYLYGVTQFQGLTGAAQELLAVDGRFFARFYNWQMPLALLVTVFAGSGLIANDLRTNAILVYLARPLTRRDYVAGKLLVLLGLIASVTLLPALLLYALGLALVSERLLTWEQAHLVPAIVAWALLLAVVLSLLMLAVSALSRSARVAGLAFFGLMVGLELARGLLWLAYRSPLATLVSVQGTLLSLNDALFGVAQRGPGLPWPALVAMLALVAGGCLLVLRARVRAVEVVA